MNLKHALLFTAVLAAATFFGTSVEAADEKAPAATEVKAPAAADEKAPADKADAAKDKADDKEAKADDKAAAKTKPLVVYWSWSETHNTKVVAEMLQKKTDADIKVIELVTPYPTDFGGVMQVGQRDLREKKAPAIKEMELDLSKYDPIYVGTPIWFSTYAPPVRTFLQSYDFKGKTVALFCTHGQGNPATFTFLKDAKAAVPEIKFFDEVFAFKGTDAANAGPALDAWIKKVTEKK